MLVQDVSSVEGSARRCLHVLRFVLKHYPIAPKAICSGTGLSRTAVHRALTQLKEVGWVRCCLSNRFYYPTSQLDSMLAEKQSPLPEIDSLCDALAHFVRRHRLHCNVVVFNGEAELVVIESTEPGAINTKVSSIWDPVSWAAYASLSPQSLRRHLLKLEDLGVPVISDIDVASEFSSPVERARQQGFVWDDDLRQIHLVYAKAGVLNGAVSFKAKGNEIIDCRSILSTFETANPAIRELRVGKFQGEMLARPSLSSRCAQN